MYITLLNSERTGISIVIIISMISIHSMRVQLYWIIINRQVWGLNYMNNVEYVYNIHRAEARTWRNILCKKSYKNTFSTWEGRAGGGGYSLWWPTRGGSARKGYLQFRLQVYERVGSSLVEVHLTLIPRARMGSECSEAMRARGIIALVKSN